MAHLEGDAQVLAQDLLLAGREVGERGAGQDRVHRLLDLQEDLADGAVLGADVDGAGQGEDLVDRGGLAL